MDIKEFKGLVEVWNKESINVLESKAHDYARTGEVFNNFIKTSQMCNIQPEKVFQVMLSIKLCRLVELLDGKTAKCESLSDTLGDAVNYLQLCRAYLVEKSKKEMKITPLKG